ncbi:MAG: Fe-S cluster assembly protein SufD [Thermoanaerobaculia bacterium]
MSAVAEEKGLVSLYRPEFERFAGERRTDPPWLRALRAGAMARFEELGFPAAGNEAWRYTNPAPIAKTAWRLAPPKDDALSADQRQSSGAWKLPAGAQLVFVNGQYRADLSTLPPAGAKVRVMALGEALRDGKSGLDAKLARHASWETQPFVAWNTAFFEDGAFIHLGDGAVETHPIHLVFLSEEAREPSVSHPRTLILAGKGAQGSIVETYIGGGRYLTNAVTEIVAGDGSVIDHYKVQFESMLGHHVHTVEVRQEQSSNFTSHNLALGGALARTDVNVLLAAVGGECMLNGLFVGNGAQHLDNHTLIDHASPHCSSRELYKGILDGKSRGVFHGKIIVRPDAQKTDAMQTNRNMLLSRDALVNSTPALEIRADDVKCRHGSTIGQIDQNAMFYLRSRGISEEDARALLIYAFAADVAGRIRIPEIREGVEGFLGLRLPGAAGAGDLS